MTNTGISRYEQLRIAYVVARRQERGLFSARIAAPILVEGVMRLMCDEFTTEKAQSLRVVWDAEAKVEYEGLISHA